MEDDLTKIKMKDDLIFFEQNERRTKKMEMEDDLNKKN